MNQAGNTGQEIHKLRLQLAEAEAVLQALRVGAADALVNLAGSVVPLNGADQTYMAFFNEMNEGGVTLDRRGVILHSNQCFAALVGQSIDALRTCSFLSFIAAVDRPAIAHLMESDSPGAEEVLLNSVKGELPVRLSFKTVTDGDTCFRCVVITDLSQHAAAEAELRIAAIAFETQEGIVLTTPDGIILRVNRAFTRLTGFTAEEAIGKTPSILRSGLDDTDYYQTLWGSIKNAQYWQGEIWNRHKNGQLFVVWMAISAVVDVSGSITHYVAAFSEITEKKRAEAEIHRLAFFDPLTALPNRRLLIDRLSQALLNSARQSSFGAVLFLDLDNFKILNDTRGHSAGDELLCDVAKRVLSCVRETDTVARIGGDEFLILLEDLGGTLDVAALHARALGEKIRAALAHPFAVDGHMHQISASIGIYVFDKQVKLVEDLLKRADLALYKAKDAGRDTLRFFDPAMQAALDEYVSLELDLRQAIPLQQLQLHFQPQLNERRQVIGAEALLRWSHPVRGMVRPDHFIPLAEKNGMILPIGQWVLDSACAQIKAWSGDSQMRHIVLAINVSVHQFHQTEFVSIVEQTLARTGANPKNLKLELTESLMVKDIEDTVTKMQTLKNSGITLSIDDFGTGYSSLSHLMTLPLDQLKIDRAFVSNLPEKARDAVLAKAIISMAESLALDVIAEGVETEAQYDFLLENGCRSFQGFLFSKPLPIEEFRDFVSGHCSKDVQQT